MTIRLKPEHAPTALSRLIVIAMGDRQIQEAASAWGVGYHSLRRLVRGECSPSKRTKELLANVEEIDADQLRQAVAQDLLGGDQ